MHLTEGGETPAEGMLRRKASHSSTRATLHRLNKASGLLSLIPGGRAGDGGRTVWSRVRKAVGVEWLVSSFSSQEVGHDFAMPSLAVGLGLTAHPGSGTHPRCLGGPWKPQARVSDQRHGKQDGLPFSSLRPPGQM